MRVQRSLSRSSSSARESRFGVGAGHRVQPLGGSTDICDRICGKRWRRVPGESDTMADHAADHHDDRRHCVRPGLPAAQASGSGAGVRRVGGDRARLLPAGGGRADDGGAAARGRPGRSGSRPAGAGRRGVRARAVRERPSLRGVEHARGRDEGGLPHRADRPLRQPRPWPTPPCRSSFTCPRCRAGAGSTSLGGSSSRSAGRSRRPRRRSTRPSRTGASRATSTFGWRAPSGWPTRSTTSTCCCRCSTTPSTTG